MNSVDNLLSTVENQKIDALSGVSDNHAAPVESVETSAPEREVIDVSHPSDDQVTPDTEEVPIAAESVDNAKDVPQGTSTPADDTHDEYGNEVVKPVKMYTEEEVQRMIRDRLSRGQHAQQQQTPQEVQQAAKDFTPDPNSADNWEVQLEKFVENTFQKISTKQQQAQQRARDLEVQANFESKFNSGMGKYKDFHSVVSGKPITDSMMMATRSMNDPAAFIYAASKNHAAELERIAKIPDPYAQVAEIGKLEERMKKVRTMSAAPPPPKKVAGDMGDNKQAKRNIDDMIRRDAQRRLRR